MRASSAATSRARRSLGAAAAGAVVLAACGGGSDDAEGDPAPIVADSNEAGDVAEVVDPAEVVPARTGAGLLDLVGPDVQATAEIATNELPDVVVDDLTNGRKVNFRNLVPQDKPILLWMWAPH